VREPLQKDAPPRHEPPRAHATDAEATSASPAALQQANTYTLFGVKRLWSAVAALCLVTAAVLGWRGHYDGTFVAATLGVVAWFLDQRNLLRARSIEADAAFEEGVEIEEEDEQ
jgi:hypothetical protein